MVSGKQYYCKIIADCLEITSFPGDTIYHLMVLVKHRDQVISSQLLTTPECVVDGAVTFPNLMSLHHLTSDFNIALEVYALSTIHHRNLSIKKVSTFSVWNEKCILVLP